MFHVFAFTYYILLRCVTREYSMTSVLLRDDIAIPFAMYQFHMAQVVSGPLWDTCDKSVKNEIIPL